MTTRAERLRAKVAAEEAVFDAMLAEVDAASTRADALAQAARTNADTGQGTVQGLLAVSNRLDALTILVRRAITDDRP